MVKYKNFAYKTMICSIGIGMALSVVGVQNGVESLPSFVQSDIGKPVPLSISGNGGEQQTPQNSLEESRRLGEPIHESRRDRLNEPLAAETASSALDTATKNTPDDPQKRLQRQVEKAKKWVTDDLQAAQRWAEGIDDPDIRYHVIKTIALTMLETPEKAAEWVMEMFPGMQSRGRIFLEIMPVWRRKDLSGMSKWLAQLSDDPVQQGLITINGVIWAREDPLAALKWILQFPESKVRNQSLLPVLHKFASMEPERASIWALKHFPESETRYVALHQTTSIWQAYDKEFAIYWMEHNLSDLEQEEIEKITKEL